MKKRIHLIAIVFTAVVFAGSLAMIVISANAQNKAVGFEITPHHIGISVPNLEESITWYQKMLGFEVIMRMGQDADSDMLVAMLQRGSCYIELFQADGAKPMPEYRRDPVADLRVHGTKHFAFQVSDALAATEELKAKGAEIAMGPIDNTDVVYVFFRDNSGNVFELIQFKDQEK